MPFTAIEQYLERLEARQAETSLLMADVTVLPYMKKGDQSMSIRQWMRKAKARQTQQARPASAAVLKLMGIGVGVADNGLVTDSRMGTDADGER